VNLQHLYNQFLWDLQIFFEFSSLPKGSYIIRITSSLSSALHTWTTSDSNINLQSHGTHLQLNFSAQLRQEAQEITSTPIFALILACCVIVGLFYTESFITLVSNIRSGKISSIKSTPVPTTSASDVNEWLPASYTITKGFNNKNQAQKQ